MDFQTYVYIVIIAFVILLIFGVTFYIKYQQCEDIQLSKPEVAQINELNQQLFEINYTKGQVDKKNAQLRDESLALKRNILGKFDNARLIGRPPNSCVNVADDVKGEFYKLVLVGNCKTPSEVFSYEPTNKQIKVKIGQTTKCIDAINENDILLNDCIATSTKQKFNYYPVHDARFQSLLYTKCLGHNMDTNIIELQNCGDASNIATVKEMRDSQLFLPNK